MAEGERPRRHHYIPKMILRNFANEEDGLFFWRRAFGPGEIKSTWPDNLFVEGDLYTLFDSAGAKDTSLESAFAKLEDVGADFLRQLLEIVRNGRVPKPDAGAWEFWRQFFYYQMKRAPAYMRDIASKTGHMDNVTRSIVEAKESGLYPPESIPDLDDAEDMKRLYRNSLVHAQALKPSDMVANVLRSRGMVIYVTPPGKQLVIGELPNARARIGTAVGGESVLFMPVASDVALGLLDRPDKVEVVHLTRDETRAMNVATTEQSVLIAGANMALLASLSRAVPFTGVKLMRDEMDPDELEALLASMGARA